MNQESCSQKQAATNREVNEAVHLKIRVVRMRASSRLLQPTERKMRKESTEARDVELVEERKEGPTFAP